MGDDDPGAGNDDVVTVPSSRRNLQLTENNGKTLSSDDVDDGDDVSAPLSGEETP
jgi:hypothetical protein